MAEATPEILSSSVPKPTIEKRPSTRAHEHAMEELTRRAQEPVEHATPLPPAPEDHPTRPTALAKETTGATSPLPQATSETAPKRAWWKNLLSKPIPMPRRIVEAIIDDYHKAFPYVFSEHPVRPNITYEHSLYFPPFQVIGVNEPNDSFSKKYPLFNEFITQEVSELAADKRPVFGRLMGLSARMTGALSYPLIYFRSFRRWKNVERTLDLVYGIQERKRLIHRAYFLEGEHLRRLEEKSREAGCPIEETYRPTRESKGSIVDESFWQQIPGKWKDVVLRLIAGAAAHVGKVTDVFPLTVVTIVNINAIWLGIKILAHNLPLLSTVAASTFPGYLALNLAVMGIISPAIAYHEMGHQMTKTLLELNKTN